MFIRVRSLLYCLVKTPFLLTCVDLFHFVVISESKQNVYSHFSGVVVISWLIVGRLFVPVWRFVSYSHLSLCLIASFIFTDSFNHKNKSERFIFPLSFIFVGPSRIVRNFCRVPLLASEAYNSRERQKENKGDRKRERERVWERERANME